MRNPTPSLLSEDTELDLRSRTQMRKLFFAISLAATSCKITSGAAQSLATNVKAASTERLKASAPRDFEAEGAFGAIVPTSLPPGPTVLLGRGFNSLSNDDRGNCVVATPDNVTTLTASPGGALSRISIRFAEDSASFSRQLGLNAGASLTLGVWRADASANYFSDTARTSQSAFALVDVEVQNQSEALKEYRLTPEVWAMLKEPGGITKFLRQCGDRFVASRTTGGLLRAALHFSSATATEKRQIQTKLSGGFAVFQGSANLNTALQSLTQVTETHLELLQKGAGEKPVPTTVSQLVEAAETFPSQVSGANKGNAWPMSVTLKDYGVVQLPPGVSLMDLNAERHALAGMAKRINDATMAANDALLLLDRTTNEQCSAFAERRRKELSSYAVLVQSIAWDCAEQGHCRDVEVPEPPANQPEPRECAPVKKCEVALDPQPKPAGSEQLLECRDLPPGKIVSIRFAGNSYARNHADDYDTWICVRFGAKRYCNEGGYGCPSSQDGCSGRMGLRPLSLFNLDTTVTVPKDGKVAIPFSIDFCVGRAEGGTQCGVHGGVARFDVLDASIPK